MFFEWFLVEIQEKYRGEAVGEENVGEGAPPAGWQILRLSIIDFFWAAGAIQTMWLRSQQGQTGPCG